MHSTTKISHQVNGLSVPQRLNDGYVNATTLAKAYEQSTGKRRDVRNWLQNKRIQETLEHLSLETGIPVSKLVVKVKGRGNVINQGTYIHPRLAVRFAIWLSDEFGLMVENWVFDWMSKGGNPLWQENRVLLKQSNSKLMDAVKAYTLRHPELSDNAKKWAFTNVNDRLCKILTGHRVSKFCRDRQIETFRDALDTDLVKSLELLETLTIRLIDKQDLLPLDAVTEAASRLLITIDV